MRVAEFITTTQDLDVLKYIKGEGKVIVNWKTTSGTSSAATYFFKQPSYHAQLAGTISTSAYKTQGVSVGFCLPSNNTYYTAVSDYNVHDTTQSRIVPQSSVLLVPNASNQIINTLFTSSGVLDSKAFPTQNSCVLHIDTDIYYDERCIANIEDVGRLMQRVLDYNYWVKQVNAIWAKILPSMGDLFTGEFCFLTDTLSYNTLRFIGYNPYFNHLVESTNMKGTNAALNRGLNLFVRPLSNQLISQVLW